MSTRTIEEEERLWQRVQDVALQCGIEVVAVSLHYHLDPELADAVIDHRTKDFSFESLAKLSEAFKTRKINLSCDLGSASDRSHEPQIWVKNLKLEALA